MLTKGGRTMNLATFIVLVILIVIVGLVIRSMIVSKKNGKSLCGGRCGSCTTQSICHDSKKMVKEYKKDLRIEK